MLFVSLNTYRNKGILALLTREAKLWKKETHIKALDLIYAE